MRWGKAFPLAGAKVAGTPPSAGKPRNAPSEGPRLDALVHPNLCHAF